MDRLKYKKYKIKRSDFVYSWNIFHWKSDDDYINYSKNRINILRKMKKMKIYKIYYKSGSCLILYKIYKNKQYAIRKFKNLKNWNFDISWYLIEKDNNNIEIIKYYITER